MNHYPDERNASVIFIKNTKLLCIGGQVNAKR